MLTSTSQGRKFTLLVEKQEGNKSSGCTFKQILRSFTFFILTTIEDKMLLDVSISSCTPYSIHTNDKCNIFFRFPCVLEFSFTELCK